MYILCVTLSIAQMCAYLTLKTEKEATEEVLPITLK
jgi:hypothetical protein